MVKKRILPWILFFISGIFLICFSEKHSWNPLEQFFVEVTAPFQKAFFSSLRYIKRLWSDYVYLVNVKEENERLKKEIMRLKLENMRYRLLKQKIEDLSKILNFKPRIRWTIVPAQIIGYDASGWFRSVIIDKGKKDKICVNMPVISADGLVGRIISVSENFSKVLLITDPNSAVDCFDQDTKVRGVLKGNGKICLMDYVENSCKINPGDVIVTSGLSGIFPRNIPIGRVKEVRQVPGSLFKEIKVVPFVDFSRLEEVIVILENRSSFVEQSG